MTRSPALILSLLLLTAPALAQSKTYAAFPTGEGDPDAITCRPPQHVPGERLPGPEVCKTNAVWARYRKDDMDVAPDGKHDVALRKNNSGPTRNCQSTGSGGGATSGAVINMICD